MRYVLFILTIALLGSCANIVPPSGGNKDTTRPRLLSVTPADSVLNTRVSRIELRFNEFIELANPATEITIAPLLPVPLEVTSSLRQVTVKIPDTLLQDNTTYRISFNNAIKDLNEGNVFSGYSYIFSTGSYFDSLSLSGNVFDALTGARDSGVTVLLYDASLPDSSIVRTRPSYVSRVDAFGNFRFEGLPRRTFRIYGLHDGNANYIYDGVSELIAFNDTTVTPEDSAMPPIVLRLFKEAATDTAVAAAGMTKGSKLSRASRQRDAEAPAGLDPETFNYSVGVDTTDAKRRTVELTKPVTISFSRPVTEVSSSRVYLTFDSSGIATEALFTLRKDTLNPTLLLLSSAWKPDAVYTLRILKGFAKDSAGTDVMPGKYIFRTKRDEDYAKLQVHLPSQWSGGGHVLLILRESDTFYHQIVSDTMLRFSRILPGNYSLRMILDDNRDSVWTTGDLFLHRQPEIVIPHPTTITLKPGWENQVDFLPPPPARDPASPIGRSKPSIGSSPEKRDVKE